MIISEIIVRDKLSCKVVNTKLGYLNNSLKDFLSREYHVKHSVILLLSFQLAHWVLTYFFIANKSVFEHKLYLTVALLVFKACWFTLLFYRYSTYISYKTNIEQLCQQPDAILF